MTDVKEIIEGSLKQIAQQTIDSDTIYGIKDYPIGGITNKQMQIALSKNQPQLYPINSIYTCVDNGEYIKNHKYKFNGEYWEDITGGEFINTTLQELQNKGVDKNTFYNIVDYPIGGITNSQMVNALNKNQLGFYQVDSVYVCIDDGDYIKHHFYKFNYDENTETYSWVDLEIGTNGGSGESSGGSGITFTDLWVNPNPNDAYEGGTIELSTDDYDYLIICSQEGYNETGTVRPSYKPKFMYTKDELIAGETIELVSVSRISSSTWIVSISERKMTINSHTSITFGEGQYLNNTDGDYFVDNTVHVPQKIIGIKSNSGASNSNNSQNIYSTEETVIGTWIDGKPIYRKVLEVNQAAPSTIATGLDSNVNITNIIMKNTYSSSDSSICFNTDDASVGMPYILSSDNSNLMRIASATSAYVYFVVLEYTKTID